MLFLFALFCLISTAFSSCVKEGMIEFHRGPACDDQPELRLHLVSDRCYPAGHGCGDSDQLRECNWRTWEACMDITECEPHSSFMISDGHFTLFYDTPDCSGGSMETEGCLFSAISFGDLMQANVQDFLETSKCD